MEINVLVQNKLVFFFRSRFISDLRHAIDDVEDQLALDLCS